MASERDLSINEKDADSPFWDVVVALLAFMDEDCLGEVVFASYCLHLLCGDFFSGWDVHDGLCHVKTQVSQSANSLLHVWSLTWLLLSVAYKRIAFEASSCENIDCCKR